MEKRLFFALWPDDEVRARVERVAAQWEADAGRRIRPENYHLTLAFLGMVASERRACLERAAAGVAGRPFVLRLDHVGYFPGSRVSWIGTDECPQALSELVRELGHAVDSCGHHRADADRFTPHLTLLREAAPPAADRTRVVEPIVWRVGGFCLVESIVLPRGSQYRVLAEYPLVPVSTPSVA